MTNKMTTTQETTPAMLLELAVNQGADLDKLEKLMDLQLRWECNEAKKAYHKAMAEFKKDPPVIGKDKTVEHSGMKYKHASLERVTSTINQGLSIHGLSASWSTAQENGSIAVTCIITHEKGHSERTTLSAMPDTSGKKNPIQSIGSAVTYLQRYTILALTGLATNDHDDDGQGTSAPVEYINDKQISQLTDMLLAIDRKETDYCNYRKVAELKDIPKNLFHMCVAELKPMGD